MNDKFLSMLGIARKANMVSLGFNPVVDMLKTKKVKLIFIASDVSDKTRKNIKYEADKANVTIIDTPYTMEDFNRAVSKKAAVLSINDSGFKDKFLEIPLDKKI